MFTTPFVAYASKSATILDNFIYRAHYPNKIKTDYEAVQEQLSVGIKYIFKNKQNKFIHHHSNYNYSHTHTYRA